MRIDERGQEPQGLEGAEPWTQFFTAVRRLAQQLDVQEAESEVKQG